jgi:hypothetical protein
MGCGPRGDQGEQILGWANFGPVQQNYYAIIKNKKFGAEIINFQAVFSCINLLCLLCLF